MAEPLASCPRCGTPLEPGPSEAERLNCPRCMEAEAVPTSRSRFWKVFLVSAGLAITGVATFLVANLTGITARLIEKPVAGVRLPLREVKKSDEPVAPEDPSERCELRVFANAGGVPVVGLTSPGKMSGIRSGDYGNKGRLARELIRQSVLMALRDRMNLTARDGSIGDPMPAGTPAEVFEVDTLFPYTNKGTLLLCRTDGSKRVALLERMLRKENDLTDYLSLTVEGEALAMAELPQALGKAGIKAGPAPIADDGRLDGGIEAKLRRMAFPSQFAAVRETHAAIHKGGASHERLGGLARGYANLGILTDYQWDAASKAYQARALLYAQRLVTAKPNSPLGLWHRAYAETLVGLHAAALKDLQEAKRLADALAESERPAPPGWVALIDASCRYNADALAGARKGPDAELAALLHVLCMELPGQTIVALHSARAAISADPLCFRAHDTLCEVAGVSNLHVATLIAPNALTSLVPREIASIPGVPDVAGMSGDEIALTRALDDASDPLRDPTEPSWGALARIVRETRFAFTWRRLHFMSRLWNVPTREYWNEVRSLVQGHRYFPFLEAMVYEPNNLPDFRSFAEGIDNSDFGMNSRHMTRMFTYELVPKAGDPLFNHCILMGDWVTRDLAALVNDSRKKNSPNDTHYLLTVSPRNPFAMGLLVEDDWQNAEAHLDEWRNVAGGHPSFIGSLAKQYAKLGRAEDAQKALKQYIALSPDHWAYVALADQHKKTGDTTRWLATLNEFLVQSEDRGLDHARVRVDIAEALMNQGRFEEARPYADAAATTGAAWAMATAQKCAEGRKDWDTAEKWVRANALRYPNMFFDWLNFCLRTGHGDIDAARDWMIEYYESQENQTAPETVLALSGLFIMKGEPEKPLDALQNLGETQGSNLKIDQAILAMLASAASMAGDWKRVDWAAKKFVERYEASEPALAAILSKLREAVAKGGPNGLDLNAIDALIASASVPNQSRIAYLTAGYLAGRKRNIDALNYWRKVKPEAEISSWWRLVAESRRRRVSS